MHAMIFTAPPQCSHTVTSIKKTRLRRCAHVNGCCENASVAGFGDAVRLSAASSEDQIGRRGLSPLRMRTSMETRELRYFVAVAEELHFARAAARVGIEQSPLSKAITEMERHLGVRLFVRTRRSTQLTGVGEMLLEDARRILV